MADYIKEHNAVVWDHDSEDPPPRRCLVRATAVAGVDLQPGEEQLVVHPRFDGGHPLSWSRLPERFRVRRLEAGLYLLERHNVDWRFSREAIAGARRGILPGLGDTEIVRRLQQAARGAGYIDDHEGDIERWRAPRPERWGFAVVAGDVSDAPVCVRVDAGNERASRHRRG